MRCQKIVRLTVKYLTTKLKVTMQFVRASQIEMTCQVHTGNMNRVDMFLVETESLIYTFYSKMYNSPQIKTKHFIARAVADSSGRVDHEICDFITSAIVLTVLLYSLSLTKKRNVFVLSHSFTWIEQRFLIHYKAFQ